MTFDPTFVSNLILILTGFGGAFLAALWISLVIWTYRDIRTRTRDPLVPVSAASKMTSRCVRIVTPNSRRTVKIATV